MSSEEQDSIKLESESEVEEKEIKQEKRDNKNVKVKKEKKVEEVKTKFINPKQHIRKALTKAYAKKKYVTIGGNK